MHNVYIGPRSGDPAVRVDRSTGEIRGRPVYVPPPPPLPLLNTAELGSASSSPSPVTSSPSSHSSFGVGEEIVDGRGNEAGEEKRVHVNVGRGGGSDQRDETARLPSSHGSNSPRGTLTLEGELAATSPPAHQGQNSAESSAEQLPVPQTQRVTAVKQAAVAATHTPLHARGVLGAVDFISSTNGHPALPPSPQQGQYPAPNSSPPYVSITDPSADASAARREGALRRRHVRASSSDASAQTCDDAGGGEAGGSVTTGSTSDHASKTESKGRGGFWGQVSALRARWARRGAALFRVAAATTVRLWSAYGASSLCCNRPRRGDGGSEADAVPVFSLNDLLWSDGLVPLRMGGSGPGGEAPPLDLLVCGLHGACAVGAVLAGCDLEEWRPRLVIVRLGAVGVGGGNTTRGRDNGGSDSTRCAVAVEDKLWEAGYEILERDSSAELTVWQRVGGDYEAGEGDE